MNPSYCRIRAPKDEALRRFSAWNRLSEIGPLIPTTIDNAVGLACDENGAWRGNAVFVSELPGWTLFQDLSGGLGAIPGKSWLEFADSDDLVFAGYNDAIPYGELVMVSSGTVVREFVDDPGSPELNINIGISDSESEPFHSWIEIASFVDADDLGFFESGWLWVYRVPA
jgi:hypothetical protein